MYLKAANAYWIPVINIGVVTVYLSSLSQLMHSNESPIICTFLSSILSDNNCDRMIGQVFSMT